ncbi:MAG: hypothetical protein HY957_09555 [Nitrospirae bacterium]|nr:hypothetical protein [Nitrospirota bacterium]
MIKRYILLSICISLLFIAGLAHAQITPPPPLQNVKIQAWMTFDETIGIFSYYYTVTNPPENTLGISEVALDIAVPPDGASLSEWPSLPLGYKKPRRSQITLAELDGIRIIPFVSLSVPGWDAYGLGFERDIGVTLLESLAAAYWARWRETVPPMMPGQTLGEFSLISYGLPGIRNIVARPRIGDLNFAGLLPDDWRTSEDDTDEIMEEKRRKQESLGYLTKTIGPTAPPAAFIPVKFNQQIQDYVNQSVTLGWLKDANLTQQLSGLLTQINQALQQEIYVDAQPLLQQFMQLVKNSTPAQRTAEAEGLLYYNAKYLYDRIIGYIPVAIEMSPLSAAHSLNETHETQVKVTRGTQPLSGYPLRAMIVSGPHIGAEWYGSSDNQGKWSFSYKGTKVGTDKIILTEMEASNGPIYMDNVDGKSAPAYVTWEGGPDLLLRNLFPPAIKIPFARPAIPLEESTVNIGTVPSPPSKTRYYLSKDQQLDAGDYVLGERVVPALNVDEFSEYQMGIPVPQNLEPGLYWLFGCADADNEIAELNEKNNCKTLIIQMYGFVESTGNRPPDCSKAKATPDTLWPPNHKFRTISITGVTDPDDDRVNIQATGIRQDEPVNGLGDGDTSPDGILQPLQVRSERSGKGNGRMYHVSFIASDGKGGECTGTVKVCAPHDQGRSAQCTDEGPLYDSTKP